MTCECGHAEKLHRGERIFPFETNSCTAWMDLGKAPREQCTCTRYRKEKPLSVREFVALAPLLLGCGGPPFTLLAVQATSVGPSTEAGVMMMVDAQGVDAQGPMQQRDAMVVAQDQDVAAVDVVVEAQDPIEDAMVETQERDAGMPETPEPMGCGPTLPNSSTACGPYGVNVPSSFCLLTSASAYGGTMPGACQCAATYTCACLMAAVHDPCGANGRFVGCVDGVKSVTVTCQ